MAKREVTTIATPTIGTINGFQPFQSVFTVNRLLRATLVVFCVLAVPLVNCGFAAAPAGYHLTWSDEFNGNFIDANKWTVTGAIAPVVSRDCTLIPDAVSVGNGNLMITTYTVGGTNYSGYIKSYPHFLQKYGYFEARIKFEQSSGTNMAIWLNAPGYFAYPAATRGAEMDVIEHRATSGYYQLAQQSIHFINSSGTDGGTNSFPVIPNGGYGYHIYGLEWDATGYKFYIDDHLSWTENNPDSISMTEEFLQLATGVIPGNDFGQIPSSGYGDLAHSTTKMTVDYVRAYAVPEPASCVLAITAILALLGYTWRKRK